MELRRMRLAVIVPLLLAGGIVSPSMAAASDHVKGVISARAADGAVTMRSNDAASLMLVMNDATKVRRVDGVRQVKESASALIPGLRVEAYGAWDGSSRFVVDRITFSRSDMKMALAIKGGVDPTDLRSVDNQRRIAENERTIAQQQQTLAHQADLIATNKTNIAGNQDRIVATNGVLANTNARINNLDNYTALSSVTIYFSNGKAGIGSKYRDQLQQLAAQAKDTKGYLIQVQGYASAVGSVNFNQLLSGKRADAVTAALQQGGVPLTAIVVPAAMGISEQVATNKTVKGQAENRRTVVTLLQSKGIVGQ